LYVCCHRLNECRSTGAPLQRTSVMWCINIEWSLYQSYSLMAAMVSLRQLKGFTQQNCVTIYMEHL